MAIIKKNDFKKMKEEELKIKLDALQRELMKLNAQIKCGTVPENPGKVKIIKKTIANIFRKQNENQGKEAQIQK